MADEKVDLQDAYKSFDGFLKAAIKSYWDQGGDRVNFISLLLATREAWEVAWGEVTQPGTGKKVLTGAAGAAAVLVVLRLLLGGPIGLILTAASVASLGALYVRNHRKIWAQQDRYKALIGQYRVKHQQVRGKFVDGTIDDDERDLMVEGLLRRFMEEIDQAPDLDDDDDEDEDEDSTEEE